MGKNSFTLFETLISILLLSVIIVSFTKNSFYDDFEKEYMLLNNLENLFVTKSYNSFNISTTNIEIIKNDNTKELFEVKKALYEDNDIKLYKYELN